MPDSPEPVWYPDAGSRLVKAARFVNVLDDAHNILSPVKINLWAANLTAFSTAAAGVFAWIAAHFQMLEHISQIGDFVGPYLAGSHAVHHFDKRERNLQVSRMKEG